MSLYDINKALETPTANPQDTEQVEPRDYERLKSLIPPEYHSFLPLFCESIANKLPPHRPYDHRIPLKEGFEPPFGPLYSLARHELEACKKWIEENLDKGFIRPLHPRPEPRSCLSGRVTDRCDWWWITEGSTKPPSKIVTPFR